MPEDDVQAIYNELNRRGVFKDPEAAAIGHELRRRGVVKDASQGGAAPVDLKAKAALKARGQAMLDATLKNQGITEADARRLGPTGAVNAAAHKHEATREATENREAAAAVKSFETFQGKGGMFNPDLAQMRALEHNTTQHQAAMKAAAGPERSMLDKLQPHFDEVLAQQQGKKGAIRKTAGGLLNSIPDLAMIAATEGTMAIPEIAGQSLVTRAFQLQMAHGLMSGLGDSEMRRKDPGQFYTQAVLNGLLIAAPDAGKKAGKKFAERKAKRAALAAQAAAQAAAPPVAPPAHAAEPTPPAHAAEPTPPAHAAEPTPARPLAPMRPKPRTNPRRSVPAPSREVVAPKPPRPLAPSVEAPAPAVPKPAATPAGHAAPLLAEADAMRQSLAARRKAQAEEPAVSNSVPGSHANTADGPPRAERMAPEDIGILEGMQYKRDMITDQTNKVGDSLKGTRIYDVDQGGRLTVFRDMDGKTWVANGHHRLELAKRAQDFVKIGADGKPASVPRSVEVNVLDAKDGWTKEGARGRGALENIRDNKGTALDAMEVVAGLGIKPEEFDQYGISTKGETARHMGGLLGLDPDALTRVRMGDIPEASAAGIGSVKGIAPESQRGAVADAVRRGFDTYQKGAALGEEYLEAQRDGTLATDGDGQGDMFGGEFDVAKSTIGERVVIKDSVTQSIAKEFADLLDPTKAKLRQGEHIDVTARRAEAKSMAETPGALKERLRLVYGNGAVKAEINRVAADFANGRISKADATTKIADIVRPLVGKSVRELAEHGTASDTSAPGAVKAQEGAKPSALELEPAGEGIFAHAKAVADKAADSAKDRIQKRKADGSQSLGSLGGKALSDYIENIADYAVIGASHIASGLVDFASWSAEMAKEFGADIQEHLPQIWRASHQTHKEYERRFSPETAKPKPAHPRPAARRTVPAGGDSRITPLPAGHVNQTKVANEHVEEQRALFGVKPLPDAQRITHEAVIAHVLDTGMHTDAVRVAGDVLRRDRAMSMQEVVANNLRQHHIKDEVIKLRNQMDAAVQAKQDITALQIAHNALMEDFELLGNADRRAGTLTAQALGIRKAVIDDYSYPNIIAQLKAANPHAPVSPEEEAKIKTIDERLRDVERREQAIDKRKKAKEESRGEASAEAFVKKMVEEARVSGKSAERAKVRTRLDKEFETLQKRLVKATSQLNAGVDPAIVPILRDMARNRVHAGALTVADVVGAVHAAIKEHLPDMSAREVRDAISGYGQPAGTPKETALGELKRQMSLLSQIEDARDQVARETKAPRQPTPAVQALKGLLKTARDANKTPKAPRQGMDNETKIERLKERIKAKIADARAGKVPEKRAGQPVPEDVQALKNELKEARDANKPPREPKAPMSASDRLENYKERLREMIEDYTERIEAKDFTKNEPTPTLLDDEATQLRAHRDALKDVYDSLDPGKETRVLAARQKTATTLLENQISELRRRIDAGDVATSVKRATPDTPEISALKRERDTVRNQYQDMKKRMDDGVSDYGRQVRAARAAKANQAALTRMQNRLTELTRRIADRDTTSGTRPNAPDTPEKAALRAKLNRAEREYALVKKKGADPTRLAKKAAEARLLELDSELRKEALHDPYKTHDPEHPARVKALNAEREALFGELQDLSAGPPAPLRDPLAARKRSTAKAIAELKKQIASGQAAVPVKRSRIEPDKEASALAEEKARLRREVDRMAKARTQKTVLEKYRAYHRFAILSRTGSLAKLGTAAGERILFSPLEEVVGAGTGLLLPGVARRAPIHGGFSFQAEAAALKVLGQRATYADALQKGKTGMNSLDARFGDKKDHSDTPSILDLPGRVHGLIKTPAQKAAFARASVKLDAWAHRQGMDASDPAVRAILDAKAYQESLRHILMNHNTVTNLYRGILSGLGNSTKHAAAGKAAAAGMRALMPIVSVPTNFAGEVGLHVVGAGRAAIEVIAAKGTANLTPEQADIVMRALKKQGVGAAMMAIGYYGSSQVGGYYTPGMKRSEDDPEYGGMKMFGRNVPHLLLHSPAIEAITVGATFRKAMDLAAGKHDGDALSSLGSGGWAAMQGVASEVPFFDLPARAGEAKQSADKTGRFLGSQVASLTVPGVVPEIAGMLDRGADGKTIPRRPKGFTDEIKMGVGLRKLVPSADEAKKGHGKKLSMDPTKLGGTRNVLHLPKVP